MATEMWIGGAYDDLPVYSRGGISAFRGASAEGQAAPPSRLTMQIDNRTRDYTPTNPAGLIYGAAGRNTPVRVTLDGVVRSTVEASSLAPEQDLGPDADAWVSLTGGGILRRLQQGKTPLRSPLERAMRAAGPVGFWPLSEPDTATSLASGLDRGKPFVLFGITPGAFAGTVGMTGTYPSVTNREGPAYATSSFDASTLTTAGWTLEAMVYIGPASDPLVGELELPSTTLVQWGMENAAVRWSLGVGIDDGPLYTVSMFGRIGSSSADLIRVVDTLGWHHVRLTVVDDGADVELTLYVDGLNTGNSGLNLDLRTVAGATVPRPTGDVMLGRQAAPDAFDENAEPSSVGMLAFYGDTTTNTEDASRGYPGETAGRRFLRLLAEEGIPAVVQGDPDDTLRMGPQPVDTLMSVVRECVTTDAGILGEPVDEVALLMITGRSLYNQDPAITIDWAAPGVGPPFRPLLDDKPTRNWVVASNRFGGEAVSVQTVGPMNVSDPATDPDGVGKVDDRVDVNLHTDRLLQATADWHRGRGTVPDPRWPQLTVDLDDAPGLTVAVDAVTIGQVLELENLPADWAQEPVRLLVVGIGDDMPGGAGHRRRLVHFVGVPASPYEVGIVGAADGSVDVRGARVDTLLSRLNGAHSSSTTSLSVDSGGMPWTTTAAHWNPALHGGGLYLNLRGEKVRVTNITGAGSAWTITVVRSVNGVVLAHPDDTPVRMWTPIRVGL